MSGGIHRTKKLSVKLTEEELERWHRASLGEPLAVWVRINMNRIVRDTLRSLGEGVEEAGIAAPAAPPSPEQRWTGHDPGLDLPGDVIEFMEERDDALPEIEEPPVEVTPPSSAGALLDPNCDSVDMHWRIARGSMCLTCGGLAT